MTRYNPDHFIPPDTEQKVFDMFAGMYTGDDYAVAYEDWIVSHDGRLQHSVADGTWVIEFPVSEDLVIFKLKYGV